MAQIVTSEFDVEADPYATLTSPRAKSRRVLDRLSLPPWAAADSPNWTWFGLVLVVVGALVLAVSWGQVAGERTVFRQIPYLVSGGFTGLGLVLAGLVTIDVTSRRRDARATDEELGHLLQLLTELRDLHEQKGNRR